MSDFDNFDATRNFDLNGKMAATKRVDGILTADGKAKTGGILSARLSRKQLTRQK
jgi:hypothetical protein